MIGKGERVRKGVFKEGASHLYTVEVSASQPQMV